MKKIILSLVLLVSLNVSAQDQTNTAKTLSASALTKAKVSGEYSFVLPNEISKDEVERSARFYEKSFTVTFNEATHEVKLKMVVNDAKNRQIIVRFLGANHIQYVNVDGKAILNMDFYNTYLN